MLAPDLKFGVELGGAFADLGGADSVAAELLDDGADFAGEDALDIHFGHGGNEAFFEGSGVEVEIAADLREVELGLVDEEVQAFGEGLGALGAKKLQDGVPECGVDLVGHVWVFLLPPPNTKPHWPALANCALQSAGSIF